MTGAQFPPPGWYADPYNEFGVRWWDGKKWSRASAAQFSPVASGPQQQSADPHLAGEQPTPPGWYPDPYNERVGLRWWDGEK